MPDNKENENVVTLHNRETIDALKQFKHLKRLKQKAKRNARKLEQPKQRTELIQPLSIKDRWLSLSRYMAVISVILFLASEAGIGTISGYMQNGNDLPLWMSVVNIWLPSIRNLG